MESLATAHPVGDAAVNKALVEGAKSAVSATKRAVIAHKGEESFKDGSVRASVKGAVQREIADGMMEDAEYRAWVSDLMSRPFAETLGYDSAKMMSPHRAFNISKEDPATKGTLGEFVEAAKAAHIDAIEHGRMTGMFRTYQEDTVLASVRDPGKEEMIARISKMSPEEYFTHQMTNEMVREWASSSSDHNPTSIAMQFMAAKVHNVSDSQIQRFIDLESGGESLRTAASSIIETWGPMISAFTRAEYANTQRVLAEQGIKEVTLYRGVQMHQGVIPGTSPARPMKVGTEATMASNPLTSWSTKRYVGADFASDYSRGRGVLFAMTVPASAVQSLATTGRGCLNEFEVVLVGAGGTARVAESWT